MTIFQDTDPNHTNHTLTRYSRSMGNNLDLAASIASNAASRSIAALDVLPRSDPSVILQQSRRLPAVSLCHRLRNGSTTTSEGSRPPSPIIEVIPVSEYETMYGQSLNQNHPAHITQYSPVYGQNHHPPGVVYPIYNTQ